MSTIKQGGFLTSNKASISSGGGGAILAGGLAGAMCLFAMTVGALVGGALALAILVAGATGSFCLFAATMVHLGIKVAYYREHRQMPPRQPVIVGHLRRQVGEIHPPEPEQVSQIGTPDALPPAAAPWGETRVWRPPSSDTR
jgi:hypothetical protein